MYLFSIILSFFILLGFSILGIVLPYKEGNSLWTVLSMLWLLIEPTKVVYRKHYKRIVSSWYYFLLILVEFLILIFMFLYRNQVSFWIIYFCVFLLLILGFFTKKQWFDIEVNLSKILLLIIGIIALSTYFNQINLSLLGVPIGVSLGIFSILLIFISDRFSREQLKIVSILLMVFSVVIKQPICFILLIRYFLDSD